MTDLTLSVLAAFVNAAGPRTLREIAEPMDRNSRTLISSLVSLCDEGLLVRIAGRRGAGQQRQYEVTDKGRALHMKLHPAQSFAGAP